MKLRVLGLVCAIVASLSGLALFSETGLDSRVWLDLVFLMAILGFVVVSLIVLSDAAARSVGSQIGEQHTGSMYEHEADAGDRPGRQS